jgi:hypothetical protein
MLNENEAQQEQPVTPPPQPLAIRPEGEVRATADEPSDRRQSVVERRMGVERRQKTREESGYTGPERRSAAAQDRRTGLERRRGPGRRRSDDRRSAEEGEMNAEQFEFIMAIETYKNVNKRMFPTWTEILEVIHQLGYRKVEHRNINLEDVPEPTLTRKSA